MTLKLGKYRITTIKGFDDGLWNAGWRVRLLGFGLLLYWNDVDERETVICDICGEPISKRKKDKGLVHVSAAGTQFVHPQHLIRSMFKERHL